MNENKRDLDEDLAVPFVIAIIMFIIGIPTLVIYLCTVGLWLTGIILSVIFGFAFGWSFAKLSDS